MAIIRRNLNKQTVHKMALLKTSFAEPGGFQLLKLLDFLLLQWQQFQPMIMLQVIEKLQTSNFYLKRISTPRF